MYFLWLILLRGETGKITKKQLLGQFPGSPFWTDCLELAKEKYGKEHLIVEFYFTDVNA